MSRLYPGWGSGSKPFIATYECYPLAYCGREDAEMGNRVVMPQDALRDITRLKLPFPLFFVLNPTKGRISTSREPPKRASRKQLHHKRRASKRGQFCSVLEFSSQDDTMYIPLWMFKALRIKEGGLVRVESVLDMPKGQFCQFEVESPEFFALSQRLGAKALLESALRSYASLAEGSRILVQHADESYFLKVVQCKPGPVISVLGNVDLEVDFVPPKDYEPVSPPTSLSSMSSGRVSSSSSLATPDGVESGGACTDTRTPSLGGSDSSSQDRIDSSLSSAFEHSCDVSEETSEEALCEEKPSRKGEILAHIRNSTKGGKVPYGEHRVSFTQVSKGHSLLATPRQNTTGGNSSPSGTSLTPKDTSISSEALPDTPSGKRCSNCQRDIPSDGFQMHEIHCTRNYYTCDLCSQMVRIADRLQHNDAHHTVYTCEKCDAKIFEGGQASLDVHLLGDCRMREVSCSYCNKLHPFASMEFHELECGEEPVPCIRGCGDEIPRKHATSHVCKVECPKCGEKVAISKLEQHENFECLKGERMCDYCSVPQSVDNFATHKAYCGNRSDACDSCGAFVRLAQMKEHCDSGCQVGVTATVKDKSSRDSLLAGLCSSLGQIDEGMHSTFGAHDAEAALMTNSSTEKRTPNLCSSGVVTTCPHCGELCLDLEEFQIHCLTQCKERKRNLDPRPLSREADKTRETSSPRSSSLTHSATDREAFQRKKRLSVSNSFISSRRRRSSIVAGSNSETGKSSQKTRNNPRDHSTHVKPSLLTRGRSVPFSTAARVPRHRTATSVQRKTPIDAADTTDTLSETIANSRRRAPIGPQRSMTKTNRAKSPDDGGGTKETTRASSNSRTKENIRASSNSRMKETTRASSNSRTKETTRASSNSRTKKNTRASSNSRTKENTRASSNSRTKENTRASSNSKPTEAIRASSNSRTKKNIRASSNSKPTEAIRASSNSGTKENTRVSSNSRPNRLARVSRSFADSTFKSKAGGPSTRSGNTAKQRKTPSSDRAMSSTPSTWH